MTALNDFYTVTIDTNNETFTINKQYKIIRKVGAGSYGSVCSALNVNTNEVVAIKKCRHVFDKRLIAKRCLREIRLLQHFNGHPRIIDLKDMDIVDPERFNEVYLIQSCCDTTMADIIHSKLQLEPVHYQWFMYQLFSGLKYIHSANVLHRDLKPANILVNENCDIRIGDFGMARVDLWSLGCIFAELLGRKVLFKGNDYVDQLHRIVGTLGLPKDTSFWDSSSSVTEYIRSLKDVNGMPPPEEPIDFTILFPNCPPEGIDLLKKLLALDPSKRITANEALEHAFVASVRDKSEEMDCERTFDFESFEIIESEHVLRQCIIEQVLKSKGMNDDDVSILAINPSNGRRRYTGSSISTPSSAILTESNLNAIHAAQHGKPIVVQQSTTQDCHQFIMSGDNMAFVREPEDMDEDDIKLLDSDESMSVSRRRTLVGPSNADFQALERQLSKDW
ncbi:hypothetical protein G6F59_006824 [Rhizopus arrhizus]|nr:hypothetical protein G6F59_006824 [Rhizopus arrhizus]